jgi:glycosyltransferase involved in cell wall biosynthesis
VRIAHVVTLLSADGSYGGPSRVLEGQVNELAARGHEVDVFAGWDGVAQPEFAAGVTAHLSKAYSAIPAAGFAGLVAPKLTADLARFGSSFDILHVHLARDLITLPAAALGGRRGRLVVQSHGRIQPDPRLKSRVMDAALTRRVLRRRGTVLYLTPVEEAGLRAVLPSARLRHLRNGLKATETTLQDVDEVSNEVLFCARLHPRKRVRAFVEMAKLLSERGVRPRFVIAGPDGGDLAAMETALALLPKSVDIDYIGAIPPEQVRKRLSLARVFVLPSVNEPFPMTVLESLAAGTPAVLTDTCAIAGELLDLGAAALTDGSPPQLADAVAALLASPTAWTQQRAEGLRAIREQYSIAAVVDELESVYLELLERLAGTHVKSC